MIGILLRMLDAFFQHMFLINKQFHFSISPRFHLCAGHLAMATEMNKC